MIEQFRNKIIIARLPATATLIAVDQHAIHERIRYEHFMRRIFTGEALPFKSVFSKSAKAALTAFKVQLPPCEVDDARAQLLVRYKERLALLGISIAFVGSAAKLLSYPLPSPTNAFEEIWELLELFGSGKSWFEVQHSLVALIQEFSCKNAIKFNDFITHEAAETMLKDLLLCDFPLFCVHGRNSIFPLLKMPTSDFPFTADRI